MKILDSGINNLKAPSAYGSSMTYAKESIFPYKLKEFLFLHGSICDKEKIPRISVGYFTAGYKNPLKC